jgi:hypothetical protein
LPSPPAPADEADPDERRRVRLTIALLGFAAGVQLAGMVGRGVIAPTDLVMHAIVALPATGFAIALWRGLRMRIGIIAFALLWSAFSIWAVIVLVRFTEMLLATQPGLVVKPVSPWFLWIVIARSICFSAAAIVLVTGRPARARRVAGAVLGALFAVLFVIEHGYQIFR